MSASDLEDLLKEKIVKFPDGAELYLFILDELLVLRDDCSGSTVSKIFACSPVWIGQKVAILPNPLGPSTTRRVVIEEDKKLKIDEIKFVYFDAYEVKDF